MSEVEKIASTARASTSESSMSDLWIEEVDEVMFQPTEIVPNTERAHKVASDLQRQIEHQVGSSERRST